MIRDCEDAAQTYPDQLWPTQIQDALRELIHHANTARDTGATAIPAEVTQAPLHAFRNGVRVGLAQVRRVPGPKNNTKQPVGRLDRKSTRLNSSHIQKSRMPSSA